MTTKTNRMIPEQMYELAKRDGGRTVVADLAKKAGTKAHHFLYKVKEYAQQHGLPEPKMITNKDQSTIKLARRQTAESDMRISWQRFKNAGLGNNLYLNVISDPSHKRIVIEAAENPMGWNFEDVAGEKPATRKRAVSAAKAQIEKAVAETAKTTRGRKTGSGKSGSSGGSTTGFTRKTRTTSSTSKTTGTHRGGRGKSLVTK